jgi:hypothetical protein
VLVYCGRRFWLGWIGRVSALNSDGYWLVVGVVDWYNGLVLEYWIWNIYLVTALRFFGVRISSMAMSRCGGTPFLNNGSGV